MLAGTSGSGKSTLGKLLGAKLQAIGADDGFGTIQRNLINLNVESTDDMRADLRTQFPLTQDDPFLHVSTYQCGDVYRSEFPNAHLNLTDR